MSFYNKKNLFRNPLTEFNKQNKVEKYNKCKKTNDLMTIKNSKKNSILNLYENKSNFDEKSKASKKFQSSRKSKSEGKINFSSFSLSSMNLNKFKKNDKIKIANNLMKNKTKGIISENNQEKKSIHFKEFCENKSNDKENFDCKQNLMIGDNIQFKYITNHHLKNLLEREKCEIKNPFQDLIFHSIDSYLNGKLSYNQRQLKEIKKIDLKSSKRRKKYSDNKDVRDSLDEPFTQDDLINEKLNQIEKVNNKEENYNIFSPQNKSSGVQCAFDNKIHDTSNLYIKKIEDNKIVSSPSNNKNIIKNPEIRENIRLKKTTIPIYEDKNFLNINIYDTRLKHDLKETTKDSISNNIYIQNKKKLKTPNYMKSTISEKNKILNCKMMKSTKPQSKNESNENYNCYSMYEGHKNNFKKTGEKFKKFFQIISLEEANAIKYGFSLKKKNNSKLKSVANNNIEKINANLLRNVEGKSENQENNYFERFKDNMYLSPTNSNNVNRKYMQISNNDDLLKVFFDNNVNRNLDSQKKNGFNDNCNTSNGFINMGELYFFERNNLSKNANNMFNASLKSKDNDSALNINKKNNSSNNKSEINIHKNNKNNYEEDKNILIKKKR